MSILSDNPNRPLAGNVNPALRDRAQIAAQPCPPWQGREKVHPRSSGASTSAVASPTALENLATRTPAADPAPGDPAPATAIPADRRRTAGA
jgi:hypothetical protein